jgi:hypothetical protein
MLLKIASSMGGDPFLRAGDFDEHVGSLCSRMQVFRRGDGARRIMRNQWRYFTRPSHRYRLCTRKSAEKTAARVMSSTARLKNTCSAALPGEMQRDSRLGHQYFS